MSKLKAIKKAAPFVAAGAASVGGMVGMGKLAEKKGKANMASNAKMRAFSAPPKKASKPRSGQPMKGSK